MMNRPIALVFAIPPIVEGVRAPTLRPVNRRCPRHSLRRMYPTLNTLWPSILALPPFAGPIVGGLNADSAPDNEGHRPLVRDGEATVASPLDTRDPTR